MRLVYLFDSIPYHSVQLCRVISGEDYFSNIGLLLFPDSSSQSIRVKLLRVCIHVIFPLFPRGILQKKLVCAACVLVRVQVAKGPRGSGDLEPHFSVQRRLNLVKLHITSLPNPSFGDYHLQPTLIARAGSLPPLFKLSRRYIPSATLTSILVTTSSNNQRPALL